MAIGQKTGGRQKGTPNKLTKELRAILKSIIADELNRIPETLESLEPKERLLTVIKLLPYILPQVKSVNSDNGEPIQWGL